MISHMSRGPDMGPETQEEGRWRSETHLVQTKPVPLHQSRHSFPNARPNQSLSTITGPNQPLSTTTIPAQPYSNTTTSPSSPAPRHVTPCGSHRSSSLARPDSFKGLAAELWVSVVRSDDQPALPGPTPPRHTLPRPPAPGPQLYAIAAAYRPRHTKAPLRKSDEVEAEIKGCVEGRARHGAGSLVLSGTSEVRCGLQRVRVPRGPGLNQERIRGPNRPRNRGLLAYW
ncbi:unnamed protein product [Boreogadus saida]